MTPSKHALECAAKIIRGVPASFESSNERYVHWLAKIIQAAIDESRKPAKIAKPRTRQKWMRTNKR